MSTSTGVTIYQHGEAEASLSDHEGAFFPGDAADSLG